MESGENESLLKGGDAGQKSSNICIFVPPENGISIQLAALWIQVPWFHCCKPFKNTHFKKIAYRFFQLQRCHGDDQLQPPRLGGVGGG